MFTRRLIFLSTASACALLLGLTGCSKSTSTTSGGGTTSGPSIQEDPAALELAKAKQESINNLKQLAIAMRDYHDVMGRFPPPGYVVDQTKPPPPGFIDAVSWRVLLLPYIEQTNLWNQIVPQVQSNPLAAIPEGVASVAIR